MFCKYCGKELADNAKFCSACGKQLMIPLTENFTDFSDTITHEDSNDKGNAINTNQSSGLDKSVSPSVTTIPPVHSTKNKKLVTILGLLILIELPFCILQVYKTMKAFNVLAEYQAEATEAQYYADILAGTSQHINPYYENPFALGYAGSRAEANVLWTYVSTAKSKANGNLALTIVCFIILLATIIAFFINIKEKKQRKN